MHRAKWLGAVFSAALFVGAAQAQEATEVWHYLGAGAELEAITALIDLSNKEHPDTPVVGRVIPGNTVELRRQIQTAILGGTPPAAYQSAMGFELKTFVDGGRLLPIEDVWATIKGDEIFPEGIQRVVKVDGKPWGIPLSVALINNVWYNKDVFEKNGITPPTDWDGLVAACKTLKDNGVQALGNAGGPYWSLYNFYAPLIDTIGKDGFYQLAGGKMAFDSPEFRKALGKYRDTLVSCYADNWSGKTWNQAADDVKNGTVGMIMMGQWASAYFKESGWEPGKDFDYFPAPGVADAAVFQMDVLAGLEGTKQSIDAAKNFLTVSGEADGQAAFNVPKGAMAPNLKVDPAIYDYTVSKTAKQLAAAAAADKVYPNLFFLLPTALGTELGVQIEKFAIDPSPANEESMIATLEALRQESLAESAFVDW